MSQRFEPAYLSLLQSGVLEKRVRLAYQHLEDCVLCACYCHMNRLRTIKGAVCRTGEFATVNSFGPHHGEED
jgi:putative pyruvate formate lyase activating enzyme